jgi:D-alanyl-D-alanine carboxypeptidase
VSTQLYKATASRSLNQKKPTNYTWENTNKLLGTVDGFIGCKTGITDPAGPCFCGGYEKDNEKFIVVVLSSKTMEQRWIEVPKIVEWAIKKKRATEEFNKQK